jgi:selenide,water dikinase
VITTALKREQAESAHVEAAMRVMATLNRGAAQAVQAVGAHGLTDITGYGLIGHSHEMARLSGTTFHFRSAALSWIAGARHYAEMGTFPGGQGRNRAYYQRWVQFGDAVDSITRDLLFDPQTSGGLLIALDAARLDDLLTELDARGVTGAVIGEVRAGTPGIVVD